MLSKKSASSPGILKSKRKCELQQYGLYNVEMLLFFVLNEGFCQYLYQPYNPEYHYFTTPELQIPG